jgi:hypothetical protein
MELPEVLFYSGAEFEDPVVSVDKRPTPGGDIPEDIIDTYIPSDGMGVTSGGCEGGMGRVEVVKCGVCCQGSPERRAPHQLSQCYQPALGEASSSCHESALFQASFHSLHGPQYLFVTWQNKIF